MTREVTIYFVMEESKGHKCVYGADCQCIYPDEGRECEGQGCKGCYTATYQRLEAGFSKRGDLSVDEYVDEWIANQRWLSKNPKLFPFWRKHYGASKSDKFCAKEEFESRVCMDHVEEFRHLDKEWDPVTCEYYKKKEK